MKQIAVLLLLILTSISLVLAVPLFTARVTPAGNTVLIPEHAAEVAPGVFSLGSVRVNGRTVDGYAFVHYKKNFAKPGTVCGNNMCEPSENKNNCPVDCGGNGGNDTGDTGSSTCFGFIGNGVKWKTVEPYVINPANTEGLSAAFVTENFAGDIDKWEAAAGTEIVGVGSSTTASLAVDMNSPDGLNEVYFGDVGSPGAIAVTVVWGIFRGPPSGRKLVEWDQVYDQVDYDWSGSGELGKMDFENIATHELGHTMGMGDIYQTECSVETMYGYAAFGETKKRSLEAGDIQGVLELYS